MLNIFFRRSIIIGLTLIVFFIGLVVSIAWPFNFTRVLQISPEFPAMQLNTSLCFLCISSALLAFSYQHFKASIIFLVFPFVVSILTGCEYLFDLNLGIDTILIKPTLTILTSYPGRMAPNTALCMFFSTLGVLCLGASSLRRQPCLISNEMGTLTASFGLVSLLGYLTRNEAILHWGHFTGMAVHTALCFFILGSAIIFSSYRKDCVECQFYHFPKYHTNITLGLSTFLFNLYLIIRAEDQYYHLETKTDFLVLIFGIAIVVVVHYLLKSRHHFFNQSLKLAREKEIILRAKKIIELSQKVDQLLVINHHSPRMINEILQVVCRTLNWDIGIYWTVNQDDLEYSTSWHEGSPAYLDFVEKSQLFKFQKGIGLPGRVWRLAKSQWINDIDLLPNFPHSSFAKEAFVHGAFAFPVLVENNVIGVIEFFSKKIEEPDQNILSEFDGIGMRLGQLINQLEIEHELVKSKKSFEQLNLAIMSSAIVAQTDLQGRYVMVNEQFIKISGYTEKELLGEGFKLIDTGFHTQEFIQAVWNSLMAGNIWTGEIRNRRKDGTHFWANSTIVPLKDDEDRIINLLSIFHDITQIKEAEAQLIYSSKLVAIGEMSSGIAHEINNPLSVISGQIDLIKMQSLKQDLSKEKMESGFERIQQMVKRISKIVHGLRSFSRNDESAAFQQYSLKTILDDSLELCRERFRNGDVELEINCTEDYMIKCNPTQISQVIINLLNNSFDAVGELPEKWVKINVSAQSGRLICSFTDSGKGISEEILVNLMSPFFTTKGPGKGTGLGLSISKGIVEKHGGEFYYDKKSANTNFVMTLPIKDTLVV